MLTYYKPSELTAGYARHSAGKPRPELLGIDLTVSEIPGPVVMVRVKRWCTKTETGSSIAVLGPNYQWTKIGMWCVFKCED